MAAIIFDTLVYAKRAKEVGFNEKQAEFQAEELAKIVNDKLVTKTQLNYGLKNLEYRLLIKVGFMLVAVITILAAIIKF